MQRYQEKHPTSIVTQQKKLVTQKIVQFCAKDVRPMDIISGEGFKNLAQHLVSLYGNIDISTILPHATTISRHIAEVKAETLKRVFPIIENAMKNGECSASTDMWTEYYKKNSFITMTVHYFDENFFLKKRVLFTTLFEGQDKSGDNIMREIIRKFESIGFKKEYLPKIRFVTDQGSNIIKAFHAPYMRDNCRTHL